MGLSAKEYEDSRCGLELLLRISFDDSSWMTRHPSIRVEERGMLRSASRLGKIDYR